MQRYDYSPLYQIVIERFFGRAPSFLRVGPFWGSLFAPFSRFLLKNPSDQALHAPHARSTIYPIKPL